MKTIESPAEMQSFAETSRLRGDRIALVPTMGYLHEGHLSLMREGRRFGSLLVSYNSPKGLVFAGRVGTGFSEKRLATIDEQLQKIRRDTCPFINLPEKTKGRWGLGIAPAVMKPITTSRRLVEQISTCSLNVDRPIHIIVSSVPRISPDL